MSKATKVKANWRPKENDLLKC